MVCWFFQVKGLEVRLIDMIDGDNREWGYYIQLLRERGYTYGTMFLPHDSNKRDPKSLQTFKEFIEANRFKCERIERPASKLSIIQKFRPVFPRLFFDLVKCEEGIRALEAYRRQWNEMRNMYDDEPYHDWTSHYADAIALLPDALEILKTQMVQFSGTADFQLTYNEFGEPI